MSETIPPVPPSAEGSSDPWQGRPASPQAASPQGLGDRLAESKVLRVAVLVGVLGYAAYVNLWLFAIIMALAASIFMHELGHYLVAKRAGMKVTEFFIGFGPRLWSFRRGETEYGIKLIWLGAYVKIIGMSNLEEVAPADEERSYRSKSFGRRMPVVLAGPVMNLLLGFLLLLVVVVGFGKPSDSKWQVGSVTVGSAAEASGLTSGDRIVGFEGQQITDFESLTSLVRAHAGTTVDLTVERDGQDRVVPTTLGWSLTAESAGLLGLEPSDRVTEVNGGAVATYPDLVGALENTEGDTTLTYVRGRDTLTHVVAGPVDLPADAYKGFLGVGQGTVYESVPLTESLGDAASEFGTIVVGSVQGMGKVFSPSGLGNLFHQVANATDDTTASSSSGSTAPTASGSSSSSAGTTTSSGSSADADRPMSIVGIANLGTQIGEEVGWAGVLALLAIVNIFLGLINLVPLLPLDGGHIVVACYEEIRSRISHTTYRVNMAKLMPVTYVVFLLIAGLAISTIYLDIAKPMSIK